MALDVISAKGNTPHWVSSCCLTPLILSSTCEYRQAFDLRSSPPTAAGSTASASTINDAFAFAGSRDVEIADYH
jgi:hypothetical protein